MISRVLDLLFPKFCCGCSKLGTYLCDDCYDQLQFYLLPLNLSLPQLYLTEVRAAVEYQEPIKSLLHELKYQGVKGLGQWCGTCLYYTTAIPQVELITSVPMHAQKQADRGYNQAEIIARQLAHHLQKPYQQLLVKTKATSSQAATKTKEERLHHLQDAFSLHPSLLQGQEVLKQFQGKSVLIIDDVITTGSTMNACAKVLTEHRFGQMFGLAVAHGF